MGCMPSRSETDEDGNAGSGGRGGCRGRAGRGIGTMGGALDPDMRYVAIRHVRQSYSWDCGLACCLMVLRHYFKGLSYSLDDLIAMCGTKSVWTVDLAYILARCGCDFVFHTITTRVRPEYSKESFYKDDLDEDKVRVNRLFEAADQLNIRLEKRTVSLQEIIEHVLSDGLVIALIDKRLLPSGSTIARMIQQTVNLGFIGHYIVVCGYSAATGQFCVADPASYEGRYSLVRQQDLEAARKSFGTDEDIILLKSPSSRANASVGTETASAGSEPEQTPLN